MARNNSGFKWHGTISKDKYISLSHSLGEYSALTAEFSHNPYYKSNYTPVDSGDASMLNGASVNAAASAGLSAIKSMAPILDSAFAPSMTKIVGEMTADIYSDNAVISNQVLVVDDIEEVARIYESNGYAVSRYVEGSPFSVHNRRMYDCVQCDEINVTGSIDGVALEDIRARFKNGIRMWHGNGNGLVCEAAPFSIRMGQLCVKDNTEV